MQELNTGHTLPDFKTYYKDIIIKTVILASSQTYRPMEQNRECRNKPSFEWAKKSLVELPGPQNGKRIVSSENGAGKSGH